MKQNADDGGDAGGGGGGFRSRGKRPHPERNLISSLLPDGRELTDNVGWLKSTAEVSFTPR